MTAGESKGRGPAAAAIRRAQQLSSVARRTGCGIDEAEGWLDERLSRRRFLHAGMVLGVAAVPMATGGRRLQASGRARSPSAGSQGGGIVIVGSGIAGLGCAYRLWARHGIPSRVFEYDTVAGGRIRTLRGYFDDGQHVEEHGEFINPEHTATRHLASSFGLSLDNADRYPSGTHPDDQVYRFGGQPWSQAQVNQDWHEWGWKLFHDAAFTTAPWPQLYNHNNVGGRHFDEMSVTEWIDTYVPGGVRSDFGALCISAVLDEFGGPPDEESALNLVYLLGQDDSTGNDVQPRGTPQLAGADEKWHIHGGNDQLISGLLERLPDGTVSLGQRLVAIRVQGSGFVCTFDSDGSSYDVVADHVVMAIPFTTLRLVDLSGVEISPLHRQAIEEEPLGSNAKFFVQCATRVWNRPDHTTGQSYCGGIVQGSWDTTNYQPGEAGILVALPGGEVGTDWGSRYGLDSYLGAPPPAMLADYLDQFDQLFPGVKAAFNGKSYYVWSSGDPHLLGAYSYLKVGQYTGFNGIQGQPEGNLHFAGEQTSVNFQGYIEGALRSGYRCATEVAGARAQRRSSGTFD
jgi:monoamine oxidase